MHKKYGKAVLALAVRSHMRYPENRVNNVFKRINRFFSEDNLVRVCVLSVFLILISSFFIEFYSPRMESSRYDLSAFENNLLSKSSEKLGQKLVGDTKTAGFEYNQGFKPTSSEVAGESSSPKISASFGGVSDPKVTVQDPYNQVSVGFVPKFKVKAPQKDKNRVIYPLSGYNGAKVYTLQSTGIKEDIILKTPSSDTALFEYAIELPASMEPRLENDGSLGVYGAEGALLSGNISTGTEKDADLLKKAQEKAAKNKLIFRVPAPFVVEGNKKVSQSARAWFSLDGNKLGVHASGLKSAQYPLSIDPSVYVETAQKLMRGNNESNVDFDIANELIQKSQTTGARIDYWSGSTEMNAGLWDHSVAAAGGKIYRAGGRVDPTMPYMVGQKSSVQATDSTSFVMSMPDIRPAGDLYVALIAHDGTGAITPPAGGGWTEYADTREHAAYYKIGADQGGGNESASYTWTGGSEQWAGVIMRIKGFNAGSPISGTAGTGNNAADVVPVFPTTTPGHDATLVIRAVGVDSDQPSDAGWLPSGHTRIHSGVSSTDTANSAAIMVATLDNPPLTSNATGTATLTNDGLVSDSYGASSIAIRPAAVTAGVQSTVEWATFNSTTSAIDSPNPGNGSCSGWCSNAAYNLPANRIGMTLTAYNGFLYAMGGSDGTNRASTVYIAKLGVNGEPQLWHPTDTNKNNWVYWYADTGLNGGTARSYHAAYAYNNRMYILGGQTNASAGGVTTVEVADVLPNGRLGAWTATGMQALPDVRHGHAVHIYNDTMYLIGGNSNGTLRNTAYYSKLNNDGTMNSWTATSSFTTARSSFGGSMTTLIGGYIYIAGGCSVLSGSNCSTIASDVQLASINADGSLASWNSILNLSNQRIGYSFVAWQGGLYRFGGCTRQNTSTGACYSTNRDSNYGVINPDGDASTVSNSEPAGTSPCTGVSATDCDLPAAGDGTEQGGQMASMTVINNGYIYVIGGCTSVSQTNECTTGANAAAMSGNTLYAALDSNGNMVRAATCGGTFVTNSVWCVNSTNRINGTTGLGTGGATVFNNTIYVVGGTTGSNWVDDIYRVGLNADGSLTGAWSSQTFNSLGLTGTADDERGYLYTFTRANPASAGSNPGNLYILGGCRMANTTDDGIGCQNYYSDVIKCNIATAGSLNTCTTSGQLQIDADNIEPGNQGLGLMAGTIYANRIYLVGGSCTATTGGANDPCGSNYAANRRDTIFARIDSSNNIVAESGGVWQFTSGQMSPVRRRAVAFGYNGYIYSLAGYSGTASLQDLLFAKIDVSTGDMSTFDFSGVVVTPRWDLKAIVGNGYVYAIGGCATGAAPQGCTAMQPEIQTFQLYNNDSGAPAGFSAASDDTFAADTDRWGASAAVLNGYMYVAGGCISATDCTNATNNVQYAPINSADGSLGTWSSASNVLPADRTWGQLEVAGGNLYYLGGQDDTAGNEQSSVYYASTFSSGNITAAWSTASGGIGDTASQAAQPRTKFGATVWNNRIYVVGGLDGAAANTNTVYISPQLNTGGNIAADSWTQDADTLNVARRGNILVAYSNALYSMGGNNGTNYLSDAQFTQINSDGTIDAWEYTSSLPTPISEAEGFAYNGYMYLIGGRSATSTCAPNTIVAPISANTTIASGNNPTGLGDWYETNQRYTGDRYGAAAAYANGKIFVMGGGCTAPLNANRHYYSAVKSQPQIAKYSRMIDTDTDVFPTKWLLNGLDNSTGARWYLKYRSMNDIDGVAADCGTADMSTWGQETNFGEVTLGTPGNYIARDGSNNNINCARYFYFSINIDSQQAFGYPEDVNRGPTIADLTLFFTADPSKRLRHGKTFTGGEQQPLDTPF